MQNITSKPCRKTEDSRLQPLASTWQEELREENGKNGKNGKTNRRKRKEGQEGATKALRWVLLWILLGTRMQTVKVAEEISIRQETDCMLEKVHETRWMRMRTCDRGQKEGRDWKKKK